jgi:hypothetical protein
MGEVTAMSSDFVTVANYSGPVEAHLARTKLESEGIPCFVTDEVYVQVNWLFPNVGGVKLKVPAEEAQRAKDILRPKPRLVVVAAADAVIADDEMICPHCRSFDVYYHRFNHRFVAFVATMFSFLVPWLSYKWVCKQCGYEWKDKSPVRPGPSDR